MLVDQSVAKFEELARFSQNQDWKINQLEWSLRFDIKSNIGHLEITSYSTWCKELYHWNEFEESAGGKGGQMATEEEY